MVLFLGLQGCDLEADNLNEPDRERVLGSPEEVVALIESTTIGYFSNLTSSRNLYYDYMADQMITCSLSQPWPMNREPRERISNDVGSTFESMFYRDWENSYRAIATSNDVLKQISTWDTESDDFKNKVKAAALLLKGLATGYIGVLYKEGIILDTNIPVEDMVFSNYNDVIARAIEYLDEAKSIYVANPDLDWDYLPTIELSSSETVQVINTYAAKFLLGQARTHEQFNALNFDMIQSYLDNAIESTVTGSGSVELYNGHQYFASRLRRGQFSYSADQKLPWLLSGKTAPTKKGSDDGEPITSIDKRAELYFTYEEQTVFRYSERDPTLYSNYASTRYAPVPTDRYEYPANILHLEEIPILKAEVAYGQGNYALAESLLNESNRVTVGEMPLLTGADPVQIADALFYENSIELHLAGKAVSWMFMRRWNLLQEGTMLHFPVPGLEAQLLNVEVLTIGGANTGDGIDAAKGDTSWR